MKSPAKDVVLVVVAFVIILGCGVGIGRKSAPAKVIDPSPIEVDISSFRDVTIANLNESLELSPEQIAEITAEIDKTSHDIAASRKEALFHYYLHILRLHDKILPKLEPEQQEKLKTSRDNLQKVIEKRFPSLLDTSESSASGGAPTIPDNPRP